MVFSRAIFAYAALAATAVSAVPVAVVPTNNVVAKRDWVDDVGHGIEAGLEIIFEAAEKRDGINLDDILLPYIENFGDYTVAKRDGPDVLDILDGLATIAEMFAKREASVLKRDDVDFLDILDGLATIAEMFAKRDTVDELNWDVLGPIIESMGGYTPFVKRDSVDFFDVLDAVTTVLELLAKRDVVDARSVVKRNWLDDVGHGLEAAVEIAFEAGEKRNWLDDVGHGLEAAVEIAFEAGEKRNWLDDVGHGLEAAVEIAFEAGEKRDWIDDVGHGLEAAVEIVFEAAEKRDFISDLEDEAATLATVIAGGLKRDDSVDWSDVLDAAETIGELLADVA